MDSFLQNFDDEIIEPLGKYLLAFKKAIKSQRNAALDELISSVSGLSAEKKKDFIKTYCKLIFDDKLELPFQFPIFDKLLLPYLLECFQKQLMPQTRWLACCCEYYEGHVCDTANVTEYSDILGQAVKIDPGDSLSWELLARAKIKILDFATHHLPETLVIREEVCNKVIGEIEEIFDKSSDAKEKCYDSFKYFSDLLSDWESFLNDEDYDSFKEWCITNSRDYAWVKSYYYDE